MKFLLRSGLAVARIYWWLFRPVSLGVKGAVFDSAGRILLVNHTYKDGWYLPGGKVEKGESLVQALVRELKEEVGIECRVSLDNLRGIFYNRVDHKHDHSALFMIKEWRQDKLFKGCFEIEQHDFFALNQLPANIAPVTQAAIRECASSNS